MHELVEAVGSTGAQVLLVASMLLLGLLVHVFTVGVALVLFAVTLFKFSTFHRVFTFKLAFAFALALAHLAFHHRIVLAAFVDFVLELIYLHLVLT